METKVIKITLEGNPVTKKNSQRILVNSKTKKPFVAPSAAYEKYKRSAKWTCAACRMNNLKNGTITSPVNIECLFYMGTRRAVDLTNLLEAVDDILVHYGVIADDNAKIVVSHDGSRVLYDKENPRVEITIRDQFIDGLAEWVITNRVGDCSSITVAKCEACGNDYHPLASCVYEYCPSCGHRMRKRVRD